METGETGVPGDLGQSVQYLVEEENNLGVGKGNVAIHLVRVTIQKRRLWTVTQMKVVQEREIILLSCTYIYLYIVYLFAFKWLYPTYVFS